MFSIQTRCYLLCIYKSIYLETLLDTKRENYKIFLNFNIVHSRTKNQININRRLLVIIRLSICKLKIYFEYSFSFIKYLGINKSNDSVNLPFNAIPRPKVYERDREFNRNFNVTTLSRTRVEESTYVARTLHVVRINRLTCIAASINSTDLHARSSLCRAVYWVHANGSHQLTIR